MFISRSGSYYASTRKLLNFLIASLVMFTVAFAAIPYFLVKQSKGQPVAWRSKAEMNRAKILNAKRYGNPSILYGAKAFAYRTSSTKGKAIVSKYERAVKALTGDTRSHEVSPAYFRARIIKDEKVQTQ